MKGKKPKKASKNDEDPDSESVDEHEPKGDREPKGDDTGDEDSENGNEKNNKDDQEKENDPKETTEIYKPLFSSPTTTVDSPPPTSSPPSASTPDEDDDSFTFSSLLPVTSPRSCHVWYNSSLASDPDRFNRIITLSRSLADAVRNNQRFDTVRSILLDVKSITTCSSPIVTSTIQRMSKNCDAKTTFESEFTYWQVYHGAHTHPEIFPEHHGFRTNGPLRSECDLSEEILFPTMYHSPLRSQLSEFNAIIPMGLIAPCLDKLPKWMGTGGWKRSKIPRPCHEFKDLHLKELSLPDNSVFIWNHFLTPNWRAQCDGIHHGMGGLLDQFFTQAFSLKPSDAIFPGHNRGWSCCSHFMMSRDYLRSLSELHILLLVWLLGNFDWTGICMYPRDPALWWNTNIPPNGKERCWGYLHERITLIFSSMIMEIIDVTDVNECANPYRVNLVDQRPKENTHPLDVQLIKDTLKSVACQFDTHLDP